MGKEYAIFRFSKIKTSKQFMDAYKHNMREYNVTNADLARQHLNKEPVDLNGRTYEDAYEEAVSEMRILGANKNTIRKDAVKGVELVLRYSHEADSHIDQDEWVEKNIQWIREQFNPPDGKIHFMDPETGEERIEPIDNLKSVVVHNDEGVPHIHAFIVPIDDKGHLNSNYYLGGRAKLIQLQNSYAEAMSEFGLERGEYKSIATPEKIARYLSEITKATDAELPPPEKGETVEEYFERANTVYQNQAIHHRDDMVKQNQENIRLRSEQLQRFEESHADAWENKKMLKKLAKALNKENIDDTDVERIWTEIEKAEALEEAVENHPDEETREYIKNEQNRILNEKKERKKKKQKQEER